MLKGVRAFQMLYICWATAWLRVGAIGGARRASGSHSLRREHVFGAAGANKITTLDKDDRTENIPHVPAGSFDFLGALLCGEALREHGDGIRDFVTNTLVWLGHQGLQ